MSEDNIIQFGEFKQEIEKNSVTIDKVESSALKVKQLIDKIEEAFVEAGAFYETEDGKLAYINKNIYKAHMIIIHAVYMGAYAGVGADGEHVFQTHFSRSIDSTYDLMELLSDSLDYGETLNEQPEGDEEQ